MLLLCGAANNLLKEELGVNTHAFGEAIRHDLLSDTLLYIKKEDVSKTGTSSLFSSRYLMMSLFVVRRAGRRQGYRRQAPEQEGRGQRKPGEQRPAAGRRLWLQGWCLQPDHAERYRHESR